MGTVTTPPDQATIERLKGTHRFYKRAGVWYISTKPSKRNFSHPHKE